MGKESPASSAPRAAAPIADDTPSFKATKVNSIFLSSRASMKPVGFQERGGGKGERYKQ